ncbi:hypothetical protein AAG592_03505 [Citromicrobium bathyomarinum]|uniref:hypothetical protein n=1 Tax=Citromicrobium bathyomarinum TaxID=72174 RepID=UPI00315B3BAC
MIRALPRLPSGWPFSVWFFVAAIVVFAAQMVPILGIFLMLVLVAFWSVILINLGMIGIVFEVLTGRASRGWIFVPLVYFTGYYAFYAADQATLASLRTLYQQHNAGQALPFDRSKQDLLLVKGEGDLHPSPFTFVQHHGLRRAFSATGRVHFMGNREGCRALRDNDVYRSAGLYAFGFHTPGEVSERRLVKGYCSIYGPGQPDRPVVRVTSDDRATHSLFLPVRIAELQAQDEKSGRSIEIRGGYASPLKPFPMPAMGCGLNSGAPSWDCGASFLRDGFTPILADGERFGSMSRSLAKALGLGNSRNYGATASGPEVVRSVGEAADRELVRKELAILSDILSDPFEEQDGSFDHLPNRPDVVAPYADAIFSALGRLQASDETVSENGRSLWSIAAALPEEALAPHRAQLAAWLRPENARRWTEQVSKIYTRLDISDPSQRDTVLLRLESKRGDLASSLLPPFCRMGGEAPQDAKDRLFALWQRRGAEQAGKERVRKIGDVSLYATLLRMGLRAKLGPVEQHYLGSTFAGIWANVSPQTTADICGETSQGLKKRFVRT